MKYITTILVILFALPTFGLAELTEKDLANIEKIIHTQINLIQKDITEAELRLNEKIRESENRLQSQFNQAIDNRTNRIMIIFAVICMGFFLLFTAILFTGALRNRHLDKKVMLLMGLTLIGGISCGISSKAMMPVALQEGQFGKITCTELKVLDKAGEARIIMTTDDTDNSADLLLTDKDTRYAIGIVVSDAAALIAAYDRKVGHAASMGVLSNSATISAHNRLTEVNATLTVESMLNPLIGVKNEKGVSEYLYPKK